ncbi:MAG: hypothetical protein ACOH1V_02260 [Stenotrophomonas sp.]
MTSFATFGAAVAEVLSLLSAAGLVQTTDTGQINPATVVGAASTISGYSIHRFADALQATAPVFIKIEYGNSTSYASFQSAYTIGTGTDGAGNLTGVVSPRLVHTLSSGFPAAALGVGYAVHTAGFAALSYKQDAFSTTNVGGFAFVVFRSTDNTGLPTAEAVTLLTPAPSTGSGCAAAQLRFAPTPQVTSAISTSAATSGAAMQGAVPGGIAQAAGSTVSGVPQVFLAWQCLPKVRPITQICTHVDAEITRGDQFQLSLVGTTPRNYLALGAKFLGATMAPLAPTGSSSLTLGTAILWEP